MRPTSGSSNFGQRIPGVSRSCIPLERVSHCLPFVTPGLSPVRADFFPVSLLMSEDLPTLGTPTIMIRRGLLTDLFALRISCSASSAFRSFLIFSPDWRFSASTCTTPFSEEIFSCHFAVSFSSARSDLPSTTMRLLPLISSSMTGFLLDTGILLSTISMTASTALRFSLISSLVFFI